ncbi:MAG: enoyl-CoA hydratase/isomerase family protein [candidate division Zixibacteria bacterium]|nr:enoyl-CoA hydratase/isomerase family protein [candidate division Zixibacteria bacterium]
MGSFELQTRDGLTTVTMNRGKVNAINESFVAEGLAIFEQLRHDPQTKAVILIGQGKFFSFGLDIPELYGLSPEAMTAFIRKFCRLYHDIFIFPKPIIGAVNGHAIAGGCILALACERRIMTDGSGKIALNEVTFGASLFAGAVAMLRYAVGNMNAEKILLTGSMFSATEALSMGFAERLAPEAELLGQATELARSLAVNAGANYASLKRLARGPVVESYRKLEDQSIREWIDIWYSPGAREKTRSIQIR